jgi:malate dehydrogenase (oxaloacetate-decarboxylating)/malate dehydrogenase (oxaloacetate-decarboxylating)(NADP+)
MKIAFKLLAYFRNKCNSFNDDIEGTIAVAVTAAAVAVASASSVPGVPPIAQQKILFIGPGNAGSAGSAGSAAIGIGSLIVDMAVSQSGLPKSELYKNIIQFDTKGLVHAGLKDLFDFNKPFVHDLPPQVSVLEAVKNLEITATAIIGVSGVP